ncbi:MAG: ErfK/YbiS/YcfS/YnhG [Acidobacteriaceae bacterium]|jgi:lipoprotein-anchoring transpeptidase ErfK/SrfK|nr:ErfK/YbiS/YcfS/YnhG [Acidobacteriaceae bacterium]
MDCNRSKSSVLLVSGLIALAVTLTNRAIAQDQASQLATTASTRIRRQIVVSLTDRKLAVLEDGKILRIFPVAVGAPISPSPQGEFEIVSRVANPTYYHSGTTVPAGNDNPVGPRWMGLNQKGYGIHGTNQPHSIGHAASHGCIRLRNSDVVKLFEMVRTGDTVEIRAERDEQIAKIFGGFAATDASVMAQAQSQEPTATASGQ